MSALVSLGFDFCGRKGARVLIPFGNPNVIPEKLTFCSRPALSLPRFRILSIAPRARPGLVG